ncbi:unnamed protein product [Adineta steineri]|uniref:Phosphatidate phosphatase APP1 catalytic domain-containing protein n=1 Tax=Adineta steineri TaxID=433720 RepID=A0A818VP46_9BILA|nr:unnamed protein product [Adineta steineri]
MICIFLIVQGVCGLVVVLVYITVTVANCNPINTTFPLQLNGNVVKCIFVVTYWLLTFSIAWFAIGHIWIFRKTNVSSKGQFCETNVSTVSIIILLYGYILGIWYIGFSIWNNASILRWLQNIIQQRLKYNLISSFLFSNEKQLILVPSVAFRHRSNNITNPSDDWMLYAQGWFFEENRIRAKFIRSIISPFVDNIDKKRISYFTGSGKKHKSLCIDGLTYEMCTKTDAHGLIKKQFQISNNDIKQLRIPGGKYGKIEYSVTALKQNMKTKGEIFLCDDNGISIISDIDDTIKITGVTSIRSVLRNTFAGTFHAVAGMSERYRHYESYYNATFHYLTASPDQLYPFLREFLDREQFPLGSYHMRHFSWFDIGFFQFFLSKSFIKQKTSILNMFIQETYSRKFILFGDIFQKDPEIYADIYRKYPERILKIFVRVSQLNEPNRLNKVFQQIPKSKWDIFVDGFDLPEHFF